MQTIFWILGTLIGLYLLLIVLLYVFQTGMMYHPTEHLYQTPTAIQLDFEDVTFKSANGDEIHGWFIPAEPARATVLLSHGNAGNISDRLETLRILNNLELNVLIYDYSGYGKSTGSPSEQTTYENVLAAWNYLTGQRNIPSESIILMGRSLGGPVAAWLATKEEPAGLILESTFTSATNLATEIYPFLPVRLMLRFTYPTTDYLSKSSVPVLVMHSREDQLIPFHHGKELYEVAGMPKMFFEMNGAHGNAHMVTGEEYANALDKFLNEMIPPN
ncbi:alpha/beta hydrolase [Balneolaceae bacterium YR4-1]|uniref:Alpha/beta hydrolase n=1 Tax=Halalkalibaculum roseum TaxID=2709311 RepID=A0A6M1T5H2_9BACT|nr:alpha/beta hydrolase [Halalkalibaculum roseum]NGP77255.1 alpha/beta hydrolase [Halalkalibaculum roseum]